MTALTAADVAALAKLEAEMNRAKAARDDFQAKFTDDSVWTDWDRTQMKAYRRWTNVTRQNYRALHTFLTA